MSRMISGGSAGLRMMIALPRFGAADRFDRVRGGLGELVDVGARARVRLTCDAIDATISA